jgi:hypothetical protein
MSVVVTIEALPCKLYTVIGVARHTKRRELKGWSIPSNDTIGTGERDRTDGVLHMSERTFIPIIQSIIQSFNQSVNAISRSIAQLTSTVGRGQHCC